MKLFSKNASDLEFTSHEGLRTIFGVVGEIPLFSPCFNFFPVIYIQRPILAFHNAEHNVVQFISLYVLCSPPENHLSSQRKMFCVSLLHSLPEMINPAWKIDNFYLVDSGLLLVWIKTSRKTAAPERVVVVLHVEEAAMIWHVEKNGEKSEKMKENNFNHSVACTPTKICVFWFCSLFVRISY